jgi:CheY-like chemotaxis protein
MDGDELGRRLRQRPWGRSLPLVALTALSDEDARQRTAEAGFDLHLTKPVSPDRLANVLADIVILRGDSLLGAATDPAVR